MNSLTVKILAGLLSVLMVTMLGSQVYYLINEKHDTEEAVIATINENISFDGVIIRNETVINYTGSGVIDYLYPEGSKVKADDAVAEVYNSEEQILAKENTRMIEKEIEMLEKAQNPGTTNFVQPEVIKNRIDNEYKQMLNSIIKGDYSGLRSQKNDLNMTMNIYDVVTKSETGFDSRINELNSVKSSQSSQALSVKDTIKATKTGYFVSTVDGYEGKLTPDSIEDLTENQLKDIINSKPSKPANAVGKIYDSYSCKIVGVLDEDKRVVEGSYLKYSMSSSRNVYDVLVESVRQCDDGKILVVMSCDRLDEQLAATRVASSMLVFDEYTGIRVPRKAIRFNGDQKGVYVILGKDITFKKIEVIYEGDDFVLSKNTDEQDHLLLFDQILLENVQSSDVSEPDNTSSTAESSSSTADSSDSSQSKGEVDSGSSSE